MSVLNQPRFRLGLCTLVVSLLAAIIFAQVVTNAAMQRYEWQTWHNVSNHSNCDPVITCCECDPRTMGHCCVLAVEFNQSFSLVDFIGYDYCVLSECSMLTWFTWMSLLLWVVFLLTTVIACLLFCSRASSRPSNACRPGVIVSVPNHFGSGRFGDMQNEIHMSPDAWIETDPPNYNELTKYDEKDLPSYGSLTFEKPTEQKVVPLP